MPAKSGKQKRLMAMVYAYKEGKLNKKKYSHQLIDKIKKMAKNLSKRKIKEFLK